MNLQPVSTPTSGNNERPDEVRPRLHGRWLFIARTILALLIILAVSVFIVDLLLGFGNLQNSCVGVKCGPGQLSSEAARMLEQQFSLSLKA